MSKKSKAVLAYFGIGGAICAVAVAKDERAVRLGYTERDTPGQMTTSFIAVMLGWPFAPFSALLEVLSAFKFRHRKG